MFIKAKKKLHDYFRSNRLRSFAKAYPDLSNLTVLDVGGVASMWNLIEENYQLKPKKIVLLNSNAVHLSIDANYETVVGDARDLPFDSDSFDLVFSNSVIEHVGCEQDKKKFAEECMKVGKEIYIQTPNRWFFIEPHIMAFFIHWFPRPLYRKLYFLSLIYLYEIFLKLTKGNSGSVNTKLWLDEADLLSYPELKQLFPNREIYSEKLLGLSKSFVVSSRSL